MGLGNDPETAQCTTFWYLVTLELTQLSGEQWAAEPSPQAV